MSCEKLEMKFCVALSLLAAAIAEGFEIIFSELNLSKYSLVWYDDVISNHPHNPLDIFKF